MNITAGALIAIFIGLMVGSLLMRFFSSGNYQSFPREAWDTGIALLTVYIVARFM